MTHPGEVTIRKATRADVLAVLRIERTVFSDPWPYDAFLRFLSTPTFLIAQHDETIVGYVVADSRSNVGREIGHIKDIAVRPDEQGKGIGSQLLQAVLGRLRLRNVAVVKLEVRASNDRARALYRLHGFDPIRRVERYYRDGEDAVVMILDLETWHSP